MKLPSMLKYEMKFFYVVDILLFAIALTKVIEKDVHLFAKVVAMFGWMCIITGTLKLIETIILWRESN